MKAIHPKSERHARIGDLYETCSRRLLRVARRASLCHEDARDALQRSFELALARAPDTELLPWMTTVVRYEALLIRRRRLKCLSLRDFAFEREGTPLQPDNEGDPESRVLEREWARERIADLDSLLPDQRRALLLQALGYSYAEIADLTGWSHTKVNRTINEGRARLRGIRGSKNLIDTRKDVQWPGAE